MGSKAEPPALAWATQGLKNTPFFFLRKLYTKGVHLSTLTLNRDAWVSSAQEQEGVAPALLERSRRVSG